MLISCCVKGRVTAGMMVRFAGGPASELEAGQKWWSRMRSTEQPNRNPSKPALSDTRPQFFLAAMRVAATADEVNSAQRASMPNSSRG